MRVVRKVLSGTIVGGGGWRPAANVGARGGGEEPYGVTGGGM
jgi:hypothetical protein